MVVNVTPRQKIFALCLSISLFIVIIDLVRRRKLREEFCWLWITAGIMILVLAMWYDLLERITRLIGAALPTTTIFLFGIFFLVAITIHYSVRLSELTAKVKNLAQELALMNTGPAGHEQRRPGRRA